MKTYRIAVLFLFFGIISTSAFAQRWTDATAKNWVKNREWANGSKIKLSPSANKVEFAKQYHTNKAWWDKAFAFLNDPKIDTLKPGKYALDGDNVFAMITDGATKPIDSVRWESHKKYIDLHYVIRGKERIGAASVASATVARPYDASRDAANYTVEGKYYLASPGEFFLFFPSDAHRPGIKAEGYNADRKLVIKIRYTDVSLK
ncbi:MAG TPA: YhcH/YjgK/YiaL family protein [Mucilaginibacter sp.]|jgi:YhcH/YjgK/YiaL family protein|nr:YhcH/YjgK/YiaL family protein [Mucilaginibacter sp.]